MRHIRSTVVGALVLASLVVSVAACAKTEPAVPVSAEAAAGTTAPVDGPPATASPAKGTSTTRRAGSTAPPGTGVSVPPLTGDFCADIAGLGAIDDRETGDIGSSDSEEYRAVVGYLEGLKAEAPEDLRPTFDLLLGFLAKVVDIPDNDPEGLEVIFGLMFEPEFIAGAEALNAYARDTCGLAKEVFPFDTGGLEPGDGGSDPGDGAGSGAKEPSLMDRVEEANEDKAWWAKKRGHSSMSSGSEADVAIYGDFDAAEALLACEAVVEAAGGTYKSLKVKITEADAKTVLVVRDDTSAQTCTAV